MAEGNVEIVHRVYDAFNRRDPDAFVEFMDPSVEGEPRTLGLEGGSYSGRDGMRRWYENVLDIFGDFEVEVLEVKDRGDAVVSRIRISGHGAESDVAISETVWHAAKFRDGRCVWWRTFDAETKALEAAGLSK